MRVMPRLRTTATLSLLMLLGGIAGTAWLSEQTAGWQGPKARYVQVHEKPARRPATTPRRERPRVVHPSEVGAIAAPVAPESISLTPVDMPWPETSLFSRRETPDGRVLLDLNVDGVGHVVSARVAESSGNANVDAEALSVVKGWRFAVPDGHPDGARGELVWRAAGAGP